jgi:hypothetical protein
MPLPKHSPSLIGIRHASDYFSPQSDKCSISKVSGILNHARLAYSKHTLTVLYEYRSIPCQHYCMVKIQQRPSKVVLLEGTPITAAHTRTPATTQASTIQQSQA